MRIISKFHDYYDVVQREGQDRSLIYNRELRVEKEPKIFLPCLRYPRDERSHGHLWRSYYHTERLGFLYHDFAIGFCGKVYYGAELTRWPLVAGEASVFCYTPQAIEDFILEKADKKKEEQYLGTRRWRGYGLPFNRGVLDQAFERYENLRDKYVDHFVELRCPVFVCTWGGTLTTYQEITYNAPLAPYKFMKVFDPFQAYQEIHMFLGGLAQPEKQIPAISDKDMVSIKGFDKWSFRKEPRK